MQSVTLRTLQLRRLFGQHNFEAVATMLLPWLGLLSGKVDLAIRLRISMAAAAITELRNRLKFYLEMSTSHNSAKERLTIFTKSEQSVCCRSLLHVGSIC